MLANKFSAEVIQTFSFNKKGCQFLLNIPLVCFTRWKNWIKNVFKTTI